MTTTKEKTPLDQFKADLKKKKKNRLAVPEGFLDDAKSYDDKLALVKILSEKEKQRVVLMFKKMIAEGMQQAQKKKGVK